MALVVVYLELKKEKIDHDKLIDVVFYTIIWSFIGARLYYVIFNLSYYLNNPLEIFYVWHGGLAIHGGILGGFLYLLFHLCLFLPFIIQLHSLMKCSRYYIFLLLSC